ncbi:hypothetical protein [Jannaschia rubra]|uniref:hypothetical protein n=1 Tax=Jannaschia rubra TaxID=282197 RepID=UPI002491C5B2|nr:hypothetical protein [Jannaschia rubra]
MAKAVSEMSDNQLDAEIANHERLGETRRPRYDDLLEARGRRSGLDFETSLALIARAAAEGRYLSYGEVADENGADWNAIRHAMNAHLGDLVRWAHLRGLPMVSAIVVNKRHIGTGDMDPSTLKGFSVAARQLGYDFDDADAFLRDQQSAVFAHYSE